MKYEEMSKCREILLTDTKLLTDEVALLESHLAEKKATLKNQNSLIHYLGNQLQVMYVNEAEGS